MRHKLTTIVKVALALLTFVATQTLADEAQPCLVVGVIYEKQASGGSRAKLVIDEVRQISGNPEVHEGKIRSELRKEYPNSSNATYFVKVVPRSMYGIVFRTELHSGLLVTEGISAVSGKTPEEAEARMNKNAKQYGWTLGAIIKRWPTHLEQAP